MQEDSSRWHDPANHEAHLLFEKKGKLFIKKMAGIGRNRWLEKAVLTNHSQSFIYLLENGLYHPEFFTQIDEDTEEYPQYTTADLPPSKQYEIQIEIDAYFSGLWNHIKEFYNRKKQEKDNYNFLPIFIKAVDTVSNVDYINKLLLFIEKNWFDDWRAYLVLSRIYADGKQTFKKDKKNKFKETSALRRNPSRASKYYQKACDLVSKLHDTDQRANAVFQLGAVWMLRASFGSSTHMQEAIPEFKQKLLEALRLWSRETGNLGTPKGIEKMIQTYLQSPFSWIDDRFKSTNYFIDKHKYKFYDFYPLYHPRDHLILIKPQRASKTPTVDDYALQVLVDTYIQVGQLNKGITLPSLRPIFEGFRKRHNDYYGQMRFKTFKAFSSINPARVSLMQDRVDALRGKNEEESFQEFILCLEELRQF